MFLVSITHHSKLRELSDGNKNQTDFSAMGPTYFELWVMETKLWAMETQKSNNLYIAQYSSNSSPLLLFLSYLFFPFIRFSSFIFLGMLFMFKIYVY